MDVKFAHLHGVLEEEIYMEQPEGFIAQGDEDKVCRLMHAFTLWIETSRLSLE